MILRSVPHVPHIATLTSTSPGPGSGTGFSRMRNAPGSTSTAERIVRGTEPGTPDDERGEAMDTGDSFVSGRAYATELA